MQHYSIEIWSIFFSSYVFIFNMRTHTKFWQSSLFPFKTRCSFSLAHIILCSIIRLRSLKTQCRIVLTLQEKGSWKLTKSYSDWFFVCIHHFCTHKHTNKYKKNFWSQLSSVHLVCTKYRKFHLIWKMQTKTFFFFFPVADFRTFTFWNTCNLITL